MSLSLKEIDKILEIQNTKNPNSTYKQRRKKCFDLLVDGVKCPVWDIEGYEHESGKLNGTPSTWWLEIIPSRDDDDEEDDEDRDEQENELIPYVDRGTHRICWEIVFKQSNHIKHKWGDSDVRSSGKCIMSANGKEIYQFNSSNIGYAMSKAESLMTELLEHPYNFLDQESEDGRKIWYYGLPAKVYSRSYPSGEIWIHPDLTDMDADEWWNKYAERYSMMNPSGRDAKERVEEWKSFGKIGHGDALWDKMINWFR